ncbi:MAG TPA: ABC transporter ATP-binding protein [Acidimicrobiales bacterium]|jgi:branched-chain amino acid transport system ATP-binding protein|nr:ABC transporter ATP-binding protein [Acidimicrobiales bacterium]
MRGLEAREVTVRFGGTTALDRTSITVEPGRVTGLIGPNGAGKTTLFNVVCGLLAAQRGRVLLDDADITTAPPHRRARLGLARTFQRLELFTSLTVRDNVRVAGDIRRRWAQFRRESDGGGGGAGDEAERIIELTGLGAIADREVSEIPTGQARVVELARALMTRPSVLLLDEPAAGQTEAETEAFGRLLRRLADDGLAVCLVEHDMSLVMEVCETVHVLDYGRTIAVGSPDEVRHDAAVVEAYLGTPEGVGP